MYRIVYINGRFVSSIANNTFSFNLSELTEVGLRSLVSAFPGLTLFGSFRFLSQEIHPQFAKRDSIDEAGSTDFIITTYNETCLKKVANLFIEKLPENLRTTDLHNRYVTDLTDLQTMVLAAAKALKCQKIEIGFSFSDSSEVLPMEPYTSVGGQTLSYFSNPFMSVHFNAAIVAQNLRDGVQPFSTNAKKFMSAHEVSHIASDHTLARSISSLAYGLFNTILWQQSWSNDYSHCNTFVIALTAAFIYQLVFSVLCRHQEKQADLMACDALRGNEEALEFFQTIAESRKGKPEPLDLDHPSIPERIAYLKAWKKKAESGHMKLE